MIENLKFLINEIELFANAHANVERFAFEFEDQIDPLIQESTLHPYMFVSPIDGYAVNQAMTQIGLRIKVLDIIEMQDRSNIKDILDNSLKVLQDFIAEFGEMNKDLLVEMPTISPLNDYTPNYTAGYFIDANFYIIKRNNCDNFGGGTPPDFCKDATVNIVDSNNTPIGSVTVPSGGSDTFVVNDLPCVPSPIGGSAMPLKTGQVISYRDYDDGDTQRGRPFFTLPIIGGIQQLNHFGNKWRFTGITGGYYDRDTSTYKLADGTPTTRAGAYPNDLRCDWSTLDWNGDFLLWQMDNTLITGDWNYCVEQANLLNVGGFSNFYLANEQEYFSIRQVESYPIFITEETINGSGGFALWSSTTDVFYKTHAAAFYNDGRITAVDKIVSINSLQVRITNINEL